MKILLVSVLCYLAIIPVFSQHISGKVIDAKSGDPIEFVSIGVIDKPIGTITNEKGSFNLDIEKLSYDKKVRFSMIGFKAQIFTVKELIKKDIIIKLVEEPIQLSVVIVRPTGELRKVGTTYYSFPSEVCGWGGTQFGRGHEIGTEIELGTLPVYLKSLHLRIHKQSFDSTLFRLHIRSVLDSFPDRELLSNNIIISVVQESGWLDFDLSQYNIVLSGKTVLSLEWIKVYGVNEDRLMRINKSKQYTANVLFKVKRKKGTMLTRWGSEAKWTRIDNKSPSFYLIVQE